MNLYQALTFECQLSEVNGSLASWFNWNQDVWGEMHMNNGTDTCYALISTTSNRPGMVTLLYAHEDIDRVRDKFQEVAPTPSDRTTYYLRKRDSAFAIVRVLGVDNSHAWWFDKEVAE